MEAILAETFLFASSICSPIGAKEAANSPEPSCEQKVQGLSRVPSLPGQVQPEERDSL